MKLEKYKVNNENRYVIFDSNNDFYTTKDFKKLIINLENNNEFIYNLNIMSINVFGLHKENLVFSKEYNSIEELKLDNVEELIWNT